MKGLRWVDDRNPAGTDDRQQRQKSNACDGLLYLNWNCGRIVSAKVFDRNLRREEIWSVGAVQN